MCKYAGSCSLCHYPIIVNAEQLDMKDSKLTISSECPNLHEITDTPIIVDAMKELIVDKEKSDIYNLIHHEQHLSECTAYDIVIDALGKNLGRYYELA